MNSESLRNKGLKFTKPISYLHLVSFATFPFHHFKEFGKVNGSISVQIWLHDQFKNFVLCRVLPNGPQNMQQFFVGNGSTSVLFRAENSLSAQDWETVLWDFEAAFEWINVRIHWTFTKVGTNLTSRFYVKPDNKSFWPNSTADLEKIHSCVSLAKCILGAKSLFVPCFTQHVNNYILSVRILL